MSTLRINSELIVKAMQSDGVRKELRKFAQRKAAQVDQIGASENVNMNSYLEEGTRPKGRPFVKILSEQVDQEWGSRDSERRRIMGRAAEEF